MSALTNLTCEMSIENGVARVRVGGELDLASRIALTSYLEGLDGQHDRILLDLSELEFMDAAGLHALEEIVRAKRPHIQIEVLRQMQPQVSRVLKIAGATDLLQAVRGPRPQIP